MAEELIRIYPNDGLSFNIDNLSELNANDFVQFDLELEKEGEPLKQETLDIDIEPGKNYWVFLEPGEELKNGEYIYNITAKAKKGVSDLDIKKGAELAHSQKIFTINDRPVEEEAKEVKPLEMTETDNDIIFKGEKFEADFSKPLGGLVSLIYDGIDYLASKPQITFWRPLTDTDFHVGYNYDSAVWLAATIGQQLLPEKFYFEKLENSYKLTFVYRYPIPGGQESAVIYEVFPDGKITVESTYSGLATQDTIPTFGMEFKLSKDCDSFKYYGYGPEENYIDTTEGLDLGVYESTVRKNFNKKIRPQEMGNRTGVRWAEVYNAKTGKGIKFTALKEPFEFDALPYNSLEIEAASDANQLSKINFTNVRIAGKVSGVGDGDHIHDWARIDAGEMIELSFSITPFSLESKKAPVKEKEPEKPQKESVKTEKKEPAKKVKTPFKPKTTSAKKVTKPAEKESTKTTKKVSKEAVKTDSAKESKKDESSKSTKKE